MAGWAGTNSVDKLKVPPINLYTYRQAMAIALWLALAQLAKS